MKSNNIIRYALGVISFIVLIAAIVKLDEIIYKYAKSSMVGSVISAVFLMGGISIISKIFFKKKKGENEK